MARQQRTPDQFEAIANRLLESSNTLKEIAISMRESNMPDALVHATLPENTHLPAIIDWIDKLKIDVRSQVRAYVNDTPSKAQLHKQKTANQKLAAAKKPFTPKAAKKKAT